VSGVPPDAVDLSSGDASTSALVRHTAVMSAGTALSRLTGFLRLAAMAFAIGITESWLPNAYNIANITPNIVYELALGGVLSSVFVPVFVEWLQSRGREAAWDVARRVFTIALVVLSAVTVLGIVFAPWITRLYTSGVPIEDRQATADLATFFLRWFMPQIVFYGIGAVATGLLNAHRRFAAPMFAPVLNNLVVIATFLIFAAMPGPAPGSHEIATGAQELVLAIGTTLGVIAMTVALWPSLRRVGFRFHLRLDWRDAAVTRIAHLAKWTVVYVVANQIGYLVVLVLAGSEEGGYPAYAAAFMLFQLPYAIFAVSILTALLPGMSSRWAAGDPAGFRGLLAQGIRATAVIALPAAVGYLVLAGPIVRVLLEHGVAGEASTELVSSILVLFAIGLFSFSTFQLLLRAFYSMQDTRTPALINIASVTVNTVANLFFFFTLDLGVQGLALGHATAYTFASIVSVLVLRKRLGGLEGPRIFAGLWRTLLAAALTGGAAWVTAEALGRAFGTSSLGTQVLQVLGAVVVGVLVFLGAALIFRIEEVDTVRRQVSARFQR
jgi:putative peptidoglycan lipid II flippase